MPSPIKTEITGELFGKNPRPRENNFPAASQYELIADFQLDFVAVGFQFRGVHCARNRRQTVLHAGSSPVEQCLMGGAIFQDSGLEQKGNQADSVERYRRTLDGRKTGLVGSAVGLQPHGASAAR